MIMVDKKTGKRLCSHCRSGHDYNEKIVVNWPVEIATWMERNGYAVESDSRALLPSVRSLRPVLAR